MGRLFQCVVCIRRRTEAFGLAMPAKASGRWHDGHYSRITSIQGLFDDYVSQMLSDNHGELWLTSNHGLSQVRLEELIDVAEGRSTHLRSNAYGRDEGLPSLQPVYENSPSAWRGSDGQLWFSTRKGVLHVQPDKIRDNPIPPTVFVQEDDDGRSSCRPCMTATFLYASLPNQS